MLELVDDKIHSKGVPAVPFPCAPAATDRMMEQICSQIHSEIQMGFADLSAKLVSEIQKLSYNGSVQKKVSKNKKIPSINSDPFDSVLVDDAPAKAKHAESSSKSSQRQSVSSGQDWQGTWLSSARGSTQQSIRNTLSVVMKPWRSAVISDIQRHDSSLRRQVESAIVDFRTRNLKDAKFRNNCLVRLVLSKCFTFFSFLVIVTNAIWMAYESDSQVGQQLGEQITWHNTVSSVFTYWFILELVMRIAALQIYFFFGNDWVWNMLDLGLVVVSIPEIFVHGMYLSFMRLLRLARLSRALRLIRLVKFFTSLREILLSLFYTLGSLFWSFVALALTTYIFALTFMQWFAMRSSEGVQYSNVVAESFRTTWGTMMVLFSMISGGQEWYAMALEFDNNYDWVAKNALMFYIFLVQFGLLNVIVGVFVARATESSNADTHLRIAKEEDQRAKKVKDLIAMFNEIDSGLDGHISQSEFEEYFEQREAQYMLQSHGLQLFDSAQLWQLIDDSGGASDEVDLPSFVMGLMRLSGEAKSTELVMLSNRVEELLSKVRRHHRKFDKLVGDMRSEMYDTIQEPSEDELSYPSGSNSVAVEDHLKKWSL